MKILFICVHPLQGCGYSRVANKITNHLASIPGIEVVFFAFQDFKDQRITDRFVDPRIKFYDALEIDPKSPLGFGDNAILPCIVEEKPDALFVYNDMMVIRDIMKLIPAKHMPPKKYIYLDIVYPWQSVEVYEILKSLNFDRIWVFLEYWKKHLIDDFGFDRKKVKVMPHGVDFDKYREIPMEEVRKQTGYEPDDFLVINMNRNTVRKHWDITIEAFLEFLKRENMNPRIKLFCGALLTTEGWNIPQIIENEAYRQGLDVNTVLNKHVFSNPKPLHLTDEEVNKMYNSANVGLNTCCGEGFGLTTMEHVYLNRPQIVSGVPALKETLGPHAHIVEPKFMGHTDCKEHEGGMHMLCDYMDFADHLQYCFKNPDVRPNASEYVKQKYSWENVYKVLDEEFNNGKVRIGDP
jgi:glycosyltransferase involved in cell wall biosynthesis|tara:strand:- start:2586 stop:3809 length:1224 start_codon:yes stop_codon:yes gene_type:complete